MSDLVGQQLGHYELTGVLGIGGMATVYRARQLNVRREVAVKVIRRDIANSEDFIKRFEREVEMIASLQHPHILKLFDFGQDKGHVFFVTEILSGGNLAQLLQRENLSLEAAERIFSQIASAVGYAHRRGIIHRDLKPHNILLDEDGNVQLTDFGIAKLVNQSSLTMSGQVMGTPMYMAPEQWQASPIDGRTDIYALGIILFEMLTGQVPFSADTPFGFMHKHLYEAPPSLSNLRPDLLLGIESVVSKAIAKSPDERYPSAEDMLTAVKAAFRGQLIDPQQQGITKPAANQSPTNVTVIGNTMGQIAQAASVRAPTTQESISPRTRARGTILAVGAIVLLVALIAGALLVSQLSQSSGNITLTLEPPSAIALAGTPIPTSVHATNTRIPATNTHQPPTETSIPPTLVSGAHVDPTLVAPPTATFTPIVITKIVEVSVATATPKTASCPGSPPQRLKVGGKGRVTPGQANLINSAPLRPTLHPDASKSIGRIPAGGIFDVLDGPACADDITWWKVNYRGTVGWTGESDTKYWVEPVF